MLRVSSTYFFRVIAARVSALERRGGTHPEIMPGNA
jgi:hypothetical protein